jgi:hypothetical protein
MCRRRRATPVGLPLRACGLVLLVLLAGACRRDAAAPSPPAAAPAPPDLFRDMTPGSGLGFTYRNGEEAGHYALVETLGGGVALLDYDGDGLLDVFVTGGGTFDGPDRKEIRGLPCRLYRNLGGWRFRDVTHEAGLDGPWWYTHGCAAADYDRDGWPDLLVTGYGRLALFHNESDGRGGRRFVEVTRAAGLERGHFWGTSAAWGDLDGDGYPDLYVCQYVDWSFANNPPCPGYTTDVPRDVCTPRHFAAVPHALYHNVPGPDGGRRFADVTRQAGLRAAGRDDGDYGKGLGVVLVDVDGDGRPDVYVANDTSGNFLYRNVSRPGRPRFDDVGFRLGVARGGSGAPTGSMGVDAADEDGRGRPSLWVTNYEGELHALYRNVLLDGRHYFRFATQPAGIAAIGTDYVGFGTGFLDVDNDGWEDLVLATGHVLRHPAAGQRQRPVLLRNQGQGRYVNVSDRGGPYFRGRHVGRGLAVGDLDNDGRPDLVISHVNEPVVLLRNVADPAPHWLGIELAGREHRDVVGARVTLDVEGRRLTRFATGGGSYLSSGDRRLRFGLGTSGRPGRLTVEWPSGEPRVQHWDDLAADRYWKLVQGEAAPRPAGTP